MSAPGRRRIQTRDLSDRAATALGLSDERGFAGNLAALDPAGEGAALRDHDEDTKGETREATVNPCDGAFYNNCLCLFMLRRRLACFAATSELNGAARASESWTCRGTQRARRDFLSLIAPLNGCAGWRLLRSSPPPELHRRHPVEALLVGARPRAHSSSE